MNAPGSRVRWEVCALALGMTALWPQVAIPQSKGSAPTPAAAQQTPLPGIPRAAPIPGQWKLTPLLAATTEVPDIPGARLAHIGQSLLLDSGMVVFWARVQLPGERKPVWGLFSFNAGVLRTIRTEGDKGIAPHLVSDGRAKPPELHVYRAAAAPGFSRGQRFKTTLHLASRLLYLSCASGSRDYGSDVYAWDGERLQKVLAQGDQLAVRDSRLIVDYAQVIGLAPDGRALIYFKTAGSGGTNGWVFHDGTTLTPSLMAGDELPGLPGVRVKDTAVMSVILAGNCGPWEHCTDHIEPWISPEETLAVLEVSGAPYERALFRMRPEKTDVIVAEGQPFPDRPTEEGSVIHKRMGIAGFAADPTQVVVQVAQGKGLLGVHRYVVYLVRHEKFQRIFDDSVLPRGLFSAPRAFAFLPGVPGRALLLMRFTGDLLGTTDFHKTRGLTLYTQGINVTAVVFGFDGEGTSLITRNIDLGVWNLLRPSPDPYPGVIVEAYLTEEHWKGLPERYSGLSLPEYFMTLPFARFFVPSGAGPLQIQLPPEFTTEDARGVTLADVVGWKGKDQAVVQLSDGYFLLEPK